MRRSNRPTPKPPEKKRSHSSAPRFIPIFPRHSGASRNLHAAMHSGLRRSDRPTPKPPERNAATHQRRVSFQFSPVIPAQAGIYTPRCTPACAGATGPHLNHPKGNTASRQGRVSLLGGLTLRHSAAARNPNPPSARTSAGVGATAGQPNPIPKIAPRK